MQKFFVTNKLNDNTAEILVYGYIGMDDVTASDFVKELRSLEKQYTNVNIRINSGGGSIFEGFTMYNAVKSSKAWIETYVDGVAASMGTVLALSGRKVHMSKVARFMTHRASGFAIGNADEMRQNAELLEGLENSICAVYASKTGKSVEDCKKKYLGNADKWFSAEEALAEKLIDSVYDSDPVEVPKNASTEKEMWNAYNNRFAAVLNPQNENQNMKQLFLSPAAMTALGLADNAESTAVDTKIADLVAKAAKVDDLQNKLTTAENAKTAAETAKADAETKLANLQKQTTEKEVEDLLNKAKDDKKVTVDGANKLKEQFKDNPAGLKAVLDVMLPQQSIVKNLKNEGGKELAELSWSELDKQGKLDALKAADKNAYYDKFKEEFGKPHNEDKR
ncbi:hypothetical protein ESA94_20400 [Lacibacter luteus]|uniref:ATP-dependent Clp protease proteolytic subunit n=1 Tax=Lacibacter luteus TaxID=2508719 RepID=A0A4Q1CDX2_9BACT|nr:head maturation protease, ClpP-related [Lacibacter luteus]RXK57562.1 hypothetical protein ESA94_20400 [Lacibacter luteus]